MAFFRIKIELINIGNNNEIRFIDFESSNIDTLSEEAATVFVRLQLDNSNDFRQFQILNILQL